MAKTGKISTTRDYRLFQRSADNRPTDLKRHKKLRESMQKYGFLRCFPIACRRERGKLVVKDGQHRLMIAEALKLPVHWVEEDVDFDIAIVNCASKTWVLRDYAEKFATNGLKAYQEGLDFAAKHSIPLGMAFALLAGVTTFSNCQEQFVSGEYKIKDRAWADSVAGIYGPMVVLSPALNNATFLLACMALCRVASFDPSRMLASAQRCRGDLVAYASRDDYLTALESVYNYGRAARNLVGLKIEAEKVMRERNIGKPKAEKQKPALKIA